MAGPEGASLSMALVCRETAGNGDGAGMLVPAVAEAAPTRTHAIMTYEDLEMALVNLEGEVKRVEKTKEMLTADLASERKMLADMKMQFVLLVKESSDKDASLQQCQRRLSEAKENAQGLQSDKASLSAERDRLLQERDSTMLKLQQAESKLQAKETEVHNAVLKLQSTQKRLLHLDETLLAVKGDNEKLVSSTKSLEARVGDLRLSEAHKMEEILTLRRAVTQAQAEAEANERLKEISATQSERLLSELARANQRFEREHQALVGAGKDMKKAQDENSRLNAAAAGLKQELEGQKKSFETLQARLEEEKARYVMLEKEKADRISDLIKQSDELKQSRDSKQQRCVKLQEVLEKLEAQMAAEKASSAMAASDAGKKLVDLEAEKAELGAKLSAAQEKAGLLTAELTKMQQLVENHEAEKSALKESVQQKDKELASVAEQLQQAASRTKELELASTALKQAAAAAQQARQQELHAKLREITKQNAAAMSQMKKQFEQQVNVHVAEEKKKAAASVEEAQKKVKEEQAKMGSLLKRQEGKHAAALEDLKKQHQANLDGMAAQLGQLKAHEQEVERILAAKDSQLHEQAGRVSELSKKLQSYEQEHLATREALEAESCKAKQSFVQLEAEILKLRREKEQDASQFQAALQQYESRLAEANARVKDAESKSVSQREKDMQSLKHLQVELEKALGSEKQRSSILEKKLKESQQQLEAMQGDLKAQYEQELQQAEETARKLEEELASMRAETEGTLGKLTMQQENLITKLRMDQEDLIRKLQAEHESTLRQRELDHESALKRLKLDYENDLATLRLEHNNATRKLQLEHKQESSLKAAQASQKGDVDGKKKSAQRKPRLQPISSSDNEEVIVQDKDRKKKRAKHFAKNDAVVFNVPMTTSVSTDDPFDL